LLLINLHYNPHCWRCCLPSSTPLPLNTSSLPCSSASPPTTIISYTYPRPFLPPSSPLHLILTLTRDGKCIPYLMADGSQPAHFSVRFW
jgi:hypothetical protein